MRIFFLSLLSLILPLCASANGFTVKVTDQSGAPVPNAVVMLEGAKGTPLNVRQVVWDDKMTQKDISFVPHVLVAPVGSAVVFPNQDRVRHNVYSFSRGNKFQLKLYGKEESRSHIFTTEGIVAIGCNIHDQMIGFIRVVDTPFAKVTDDNGEVVFDAPETGAVLLSSWHPKSKDQSDVIMSAELADSAANITLNMSSHNKSNSH
jgi:plastocyanin